ncbi:MAG: gamma-tubulin complex component 2 [Amphiamblys sp. WSBS2006]|nr:MAG: gamma-tubulin complex component 2 [Amphiamblys sp. WSBS2006]
MEGMTVLQQQETAVMEDLFYLFLGFNGKHVRTSTAETAKRKTFVIDSGLDTALVSKIQDSVLPLCQAVQSIQSYIDGGVEERSEKRRTAIVRGFCSGLRTYTGNLYRDIAQIEEAFHRGEMTLQKFCVRAGRVARTAPNIAEVVAVVDGCGRDSEIVAQLHQTQQRMAADSELAEQILFLLDCAKRPYLEWLEGWLCFGRVSCDPGFFIREKKDIKRDSSDYGKDWWTEHYAADAAAVPFFLQKSIKKIVLTGKYCSALRGCGIDPQRQTLYTETQAGMERGILFLYRETDTRLMGLLQIEKKMHAVLGTIKRNFFIEDPSLVSSFIDIAFAELLKTRGGVVQEQRLRECFDIVTDGDCFLRCSFASESLSQHLLRVLSGDGGRKTEERGARVFHSFEAFTLDFTASFPLNIVLSQKTISKYQLVFRQLFLLHFFKRAMAGMWAKGTKPFGLSPELAKQSCLFKRKILGFIDTLQFFLSLDVLERRWKIFEGKAEQAEDIEGFVTAHDEYLDSSLRECMLTNPKLIEITATMWGVCKEFCDEHSRIETECLCVAEGEGLVSSALGRVDELSRRFDKTLRVLIDGLHFYSTADYDYHLGALAARLDFNGFYSRG